VAVEIRDALNIEVELIAGSGGVFIIMYGENIVYNKRDSGVFPAEGAIVELLRR
jgi:predicted Rdx family selenoprotein